MTNYMTDILKVWCPKLTDYQLQQLAYSLVPGLETAEHNFITYSILTKMLMETRYEV